jgi:hypothetical protein
MKAMIRLAVVSDLAVIEEIVRDAYEPWVQVIGGRPAPMDADYAPLIAARKGRSRVLPRCPLPATRTGLSFSFPSPECCWWRTSPSGRQSIPTGHLMHLRKQLKVR